MHGLGGKNDAKQARKLALKKLVKNEFSIGYVKTHMRFWEFPTLENKSCRWQLFPRGLYQDFTLDWVGIWIANSTMCWIWWLHAVLKDDLNFDDVFSTGKWTQITVNPTCRSGTRQQYSGPWEHWYGASASLPDSAFLAPGCLQVAFWTQNESPSHNLSLQIYSLWLLPQWEWFTDIWLHNGKEGVTLQISYSWS